MEAALKEDRDTDIVLKIKSGVSFLQEINRNFNYKKESCGCKTYIPKANIN
jgi:hypothetical protein